MADRSEKPPPTPTKEEFDEDGKPIHVAGTGIRKPDYDALNAAIGRLMLTSQSAVQTAHNSLARRELWLSKLLLFHYSRLVHAPCFHIDTSSGGEYPEITQDYAQYMEYLRTQGRSIHCNILMFLSIATDIPSGRPESPPRPQGIISESPRKRKFLPVLVLHSRELALM
jgi:hypothetical protein